MSARGLFLGAALALAAGPALGCGVPALSPVPVQVGKARDPAAVLVMPVGWEAGDPASVLLSAPAFRAGCAEPRVAALLEAGAMVLAIDPGAAGPDGALLAAARLLRAAYGAGEVAVMWPAATACAAPVVSAAWPPSRVCTRR